MHVVNKYIRYDSLCRQVNVPKGGFIFGIGDWIRGSVALFDICGRHDARFTADVSEHPVAGFLTGDTPPATSRPPICLPAESSARVDAFLAQNREAAGVLPVYANCWPIHPVSSECKAYMREVLRPNPVLEPLIGAAMARLGIRDGDYACVSVRTGDNVFDGTTSPVDHDAVGRRIAAMLATSPHGDGDKVVVSDDGAMCEFLHRRYGFRMRNTRPCHLGRCAEGDPDIADTLVDFFLLARSKAIFHYTVYRWTSGFCNWKSQIYDVPLVRS
jgi:hypothetical protein